MIFPLRWRYLAVVALVVLNAADLLLTHAALHRGAYEANPIMAPIVTGWAGTVVKLALPVFVGALFLWRNPRARLWTGLWIAVALYVLIVAWNVKEAIA